MRSKTEVFELAYKRGEIVYLKTDPHQAPRIVIGYEIMAAISYIVKSGTDVSCHTDIELTDRVDEFFAVTNKINKEE